MNRIKLYFSYRVPNAGRPSGTTRSATGAHMKKARSVRKTSRHWSSTGERKRRPKFGYLAALTVAVVVPGYLGPSRPHAGAVK